MDVGPLWGRWAGSQAYWYRQETIPAQTRNRFKPGAVFSTMPPPARQRIPGSHRT